MNATDPRSDDVKRAQRPSGALRSLPTPPDAPISHRVADASADAAGPPAPAPAELEALMPAYRRLLGR